MAGMQPKLTKLELRIMEIVWASGPLAVRDVQARLAAARRPAYTTVQTLMYRLEAKKALKRTAKIGNAHLFEAAVTRQSAHRRLIDEFIALLGGSIRPVMANLVDAGKLTLDDVREAEKHLQKISRKGGKP